MRGILVALGLFCLIVTVSVYCCLAWSNPDMTTRRLWIDFPFTMIGILLGYVVSGILIMVGGNCRK